MNFPLPEIFALITVEYISIPEYKTPVEINENNIYVYEDLRGRMDFNFEPTISTRRIRNQPNIQAPVQVYLSPAAIAAIRG